MVAGHQEVSMRIIPLLTACLLGCCMLGCSKSPDADAPPPPQKTVFDPMTHTLDRAKDVQKTVDENAASTARSAAAEERGDEAH